MELLDLGERGDEVVHLAAARVAVLDVERRHLLRQLREPLLQLVVLADAREGLGAGKGLGELREALDDLRARLGPHLLLRVQQRLEHDPQLVLELRRVHQHQQ